jgi:FSR family fosmidomycin resistance protein-like MFS transporter
MKEQSLAAPSGMTEEASVAPLVEEEFNGAGVATISAAHFIHDAYPAIVGQLLPFLMDKHGLTYAVAGGLATVNRWPSVAQPFMGYWADRRDARLLLLLPPAITAVAISCLGLAPNYMALVMLMLVAGISSAAFHPTASGMVTRGAGRQWGRATSCSMAGGELGRAVGPLYITVLIATIGFGNIWIGAIPGVAITAVAFMYLRGSRLNLGAQPVPSGLREALGSAWRPLLLLAGMILFRSLSIASFQTFYPSFLTSAGANIVFAGLSLTLYEVGGVGGAFLGGPLSDRFGRRETMILSQLTAGPLLFGAMMFAQEPLGLVFLILGGLLAVSGAPVQLTLVQELMPKNRSVASGIMMFLGFESSVVATLLTGFLADMMGIQTALTWTILASMASIPFTLLLPKTGQVRPSPAV